MTTDADTRLTQSQYETLLADGRSTRPRMTPEERLRRKRATSRLSAEARRRATTVLINNHQQEYWELYDLEKKALQDDERYRI